MVSILPLNLAFIHVGDYQRPRAVCEGEIIKGYPRRKSFSNEKIRVGTRVYRKITAGSLLGFCTCSHRRQQVSIFCYLAMATRSFANFNENSTQPCNSRQRAFVHLIRTNISNYELTHLSTVIPLSSHSSLPELKRIPAPIQLLRSLDSLITHKD